MCCIVAVLLLLIYIISGEGFANKSEKYQAVADWFRGNPRGGYGKFRQDLEANVVDYENARELWAVGRLTRENLIKSSGG